MYADTAYTDVGDDVPSPLLKWSAVFGGLVLGLATLLLLSALWLALAYGSGATAIRDNLRWYVGASAIVSLFLAGILTGYLSGVRGAWPGMLHGFTLLGLLMLLAVTVGIPSLLNVFGLDRLASGATTTSTLVSRGNDGTLWVTFWTLVGGFVAAGIGGVIGGVSSRAERVGPTVVADQRPIVREQPPAMRTGTLPPRSPDTVVVDEESQSTRA
jgi:hypothetical protein